MTTDIPEEIKKMFDEFRLRTLADPLSVTSDKLLENEHIRIRAYMLVRLCEIRITYTDKVNYENSCQSSVLISRELYSNARRDYYESFGILLNPGSFYDLADYINSEIGRVEINRNAMTNRCPSSSDEPLSSDMLATAYNRLGNRDVLHADHRQEGRHPPYPLIGIEWEPQLTLLNYPNLPVIVVKCFCRDTIHATKDLCNCVWMQVRETEFMGVVFLKLPIYGIVDVGVNNIEFRTPPVKLEELQEQVRITDANIENMVCKISEACGPVGIFLPAYPRSKHVNYSDGHLKKGSFFKLGIYGFRRHLKVQYDFIDYEKIVKNKGMYYSSGEKMMKRPIFLGYSMAGEKYIRKNRLM